MRLRYGCEFVDINFLAFKFRFIFLLKIIYQTIALISRKVVINFFEQKVVMNLIDLNSNILN